MICGSCHLLDPQNRIKADDGWILSSQEQAEWVSSPHNSASSHAGYLTCITCHNQHKSSVYNQGGVRDYPTCSACHSDHEIPGKESLDCIDCHMPYSVKASKVFSENEADMRSHQFRIWVTTFPKDSTFYQDATGTYVKLDVDGQTFGNTLDVVCLRCHSNWSIDDVYEAARNIHEEGVGVISSPAQTHPTGFEVLQNYPNPFNPETTIEFTLPYKAHINLSILDIGGKLIADLVSDYLPAGQHSVIFNGDELTSGIYFYRVSTESYTYTGKMLLLK